MGLCAEQSQYSRPEPALERPACRRAWAGMWNLDVGRVPTVFQTSKLLTVTKMFVQIIFTVNTCFPSRCPDFSVCARQERST